MEFSWEGLIYIYSDRIKSNKNVTSHPSLEFTIKILKSDDDFVTVHEYI